MVIDCTGTVEGQESFGSEKSGEFLPNLKGRLVRGSSWVFITKAIQQVFFWIRTIILARLLSPNDFGLFGVALLVMLMLDAFSQTGFRQALIQRNENVDNMLNSAWSVDLVRGAAISVILFISAPFTASFFATPQAASIQRVIAIAFLVRSVTNISIIFFEKRMEFHKYFIFNLSILVADLTVSVALAFILRNVWAIVIGFLAGECVRCVVSYMIETFRPRFEFDKTAIESLTNFGKWVFSSSLVIFLLTKGDDICVGKILGATALGFYQMAYFISNLPATEITQVVCMVTFPAFSKIQNDIIKTKRLFIFVLNLSLFAVLPVALLIGVFIPDITRIFLGDKWLPLVPAVQVLCIFGITTTVNTVIGTFFSAIGRPQIVTVTATAQLLLFVLIVYPFTKTHGIVGASWAVVITNALAAAYFVFKVSRFFELKATQQIYLLLPQFVGILSTLVFLVAIKGLFSGELSLLALVVSAISSLVVYLVAVFFTDLHAKCGIIKEIRSSFVR